MIRDAFLLNKPIKVVKRYFISLPREDLHSGHPTGNAGVFAQKLNPEVSPKILDMVQSGITDVKEIKQMGIACLEPSLINCLVLMSVDC